MEWNGSTRFFVPPPDSSLSFLYNYNNYTQFPGMEVKQQEALMVEAPQAMGKMMKCRNQQEEKKKKKRLTSDQLESLESSFQKEIKLDPDKKMKLSKELGIQPRQIAIWFQNRRARWKAKQLENLYHSLKQEFDVISKEKHKLEEEVMKLKGMLLREQGCGTELQVSGGGGGYTEMSGSAGEEETTVESTSLQRNNTNKINLDHQGNCSFTTLEDYTDTLPALPYWPSSSVPYYHPK